MNLVSVLLLISYQIPIQLTLIKKFLTPIVIDNIKYFTISKAFIAD